MLHLPTITLIKQLWSDWFNGFINGLTGSGENGVSCFPLLCHLLRLLPENQLCKIRAAAQVRQLSSLQQRDTNAPRNPIVSGY